MIVEVLCKSGTNLLICGPLKMIAFAKLSRENYGLPLPGGLGVVGSNPAAPTRI
jgi:hypothetical protein